MFDRKTKVKYLYIDYYRFYIFNVIPYIELFLSSSRHVIMIKILKTVPRKINIMSLMIIEMKGLDMYVN